MIKRVKNNWKGLLGIGLFVLVLLLILAFMPMDDNVPVTGYFVYGGGQGQTEEVILEDEERETEGIVTPNFLRGGDDGSVNRGRGNNRGGGGEGIVVKSKNKTDNETGRGGGGGPPRIFWPGIRLRDRKWGSRFDFSHRWNRLGGDFYDLEMDRYGQKIRKLKFRNVRLGQGEDFNLRIDESDDLIKKSKYRWRKMFAIDPSSIDFVDGEITSIAEGESLYKCKDWNYTLQKCMGRWIKLQDLVPGQEYNIAIDPKDPGFAEMGVASINTNKSRYLVNETVGISVVVLNTSGYLVSGANVSVEVIDPNNAISYFSTDSSTVVEISTGIYSVIFSNTSLAGEYGLYVEAVGDGVNNSMYSEFLVESDYPFEILRNTPVTIDPWLGPTNTSFELVSRNYTEEFNFTEVLPNNFTITNSGGGIISYVGDSILIEWGNLSNGSIIGYSAQAPLVTPELYTLGKGYVEYGGLNFSEGRLWYLAVDPVITVVNTSTANATAPGNISALAGNVTEITIGGDSVTQAWQGYFGNVSGTIVLEDSSGNTLYNWSENSPEGEVYASRSDSVDFDLVRCANNSEMLAEETAMGQVTSDPDSVSNTFTKNLHPQFYAAKKDIALNSCNSTNIYDLTGPQNSYFYEILLSDTNDIIYTALMEEDQIGFDNRTHDFEMLVAEDGHGTDTNTTPYWFYMELY